MPTTVDDIPDLIDRLCEIYEESVGGLRSALAHYLKTGDPPSPRKRAKGLFAYPELRLDYPHGSPIQFPRRAFGRLNQPGRYTISITRPRLFRKYLTEQLTYLLGDYEVDVSVGRSASEIPYPYVLDSRGETSIPLANLTNGQEESYDTREFYRADADLYFNAFGSHHIRLGYDRENLTSIATNNYTGGVFYDMFDLPNGSTNFRDNGVPLPPGAEYVTARTFENDGTFHTKNEAFYIQDNWSMFDDRLTLQLGLRNDRFENRNVADEVYYSSGDQWGPRLGFSFDPTGDSRTKIYGSFGRYFLPIAANTNLRLAGAEYDVTTYYRLLGINEDGTPILGNPLTHPNLRQCIRINSASCAITSDGEVEDTEIQVAKNLKPQSMDEFILGAEHRFGDGLRVGLYGTYRKLNRALEDAAIDQAVNAYCEAEFGDDWEEVEGCDGYTGFHRYVLINPGADSVIKLDPINGEAEGRVVTFTAEDLGYPKARRTYKAITAEFDRLVSDVVDALVTVAASDRVGAPRRGCDRRHGGRFEREELDAVRFVPLIGAQGWPDERT